jgi:hypothetical protein
MSAQPQPGDYRWRGNRDREADATGLITAALCGDTRASGAILGSLERPELIALCWTLGAWYAELARREMVVDPLTKLREVALQRDRRTVRGSTGSEQ